MNTAIDIKNLKPDEIISTAESGVSSELVKLIFQLNIYIRYILSNTSKENGADLFDKYPAAFIKVERAFIYYFTTCMYKYVFTGNGKGRNDKSAGLQTLRRFFETENNLSCYKLYQYLLAGQVSQGPLAPFKNSDLAGNFFENMYTGSPYFSIEDADTYIPDIFGGNLTSVDLFKPETIKSLGGVWSKKFIKTITKQYHSPEAQLLRKVIQATKGFEDDVYPLENLLDDKRIKPFFTYDKDKEGQYIFNKQSQDTIRNLFSLGEFSTQAWTERRADDFYHQFITEVNLDDCEEAYKEHQKELKQKKEDVISPEELANQLALNVANYMTGKITAQEFQAEDKRIRALTRPNEDPSQNNENGTVLNEIE